MKDMAANIELSLEQLREIGKWAADCAERALPIYEAQIGSDTRPREAIEGIRLFANGGKRTAQLRKQALAAFAAAREVADPAATAAARAACLAARAACLAARAACLAASSAYTHPLADVEQTKHIVGPAAYAALAIELNQGGEERIGDEVVCWAIEHAPCEAGEVLVQMDARQPGKDRLNRLMYDVDRGLRAQILFLKE